MESNTHGVNPENYYDKYSRSKIPRPEPKGAISWIWSRLIKETLFPGFVIMMAPFVSLMLPYIVIHYNSDLERCLFDGHWRETIAEVMWKSAAVGLRIDDWEIWAILGTCLLWGLMSTFAIGGAYYYGPLVVDGYRPEYRKSAVRFYVISLIATLPFLYFLPALHIFYKIPAMTASLTLIGLVLSGVMYFKAIWFPSPGQTARSGNAIADFFYGIELSPSLLDPIIDLKIAFVSRFGIWLWQVIVLVAWKANYELYHAAFRRGDFNWSMLAATIIQTGYIFKFYLNEEVYTHSFEMTNSNLGYYLCFGGLTIIPTLYPLLSLHLVRHSPHVEEFGFYSFVLTVATGLALIYWSYHIDRQRYFVRAVRGLGSNSGGSTTEKNDLNMWPYPSCPAKLIRAKYTTPKGVEMTTVLLAGGWWGVARHLNYLVDWLIGFLWCMCSCSWDSPIPHLYWIILLVFLLNRERRDNAKCSTKYGNYWNEYCKIVRYRIIPFIY